MADYDSETRLPVSLSPSFAGGSDVPAEGADASADDAAAAPVSTSSPLPSRALSPASLDLARRRLATKRAYRATLRTLTEWALTFELTPARFEMLAAIASHPLGTTQRAISHSLSISQGTTSRMVARLVRLGLVDVAPNPGDARKRLLCVSPEGQRRLTAAQASFFDGGFGPTDPNLPN